MQYHWCSWSSALQSLQTKSLVNKRARWKGFQFEDWAFSESEQVRESFLKGIFLKFRPRKQINQLPILETVSSGQSVRTIEWLPFNLIKMLHQSHFISWLSWQCQLYIPSGTANHRESLSSWIPVPIVALSFSWKFKLMFAIRTLEVQILDITHWENTGKPEIWSIQGIHWILSSSLYVRWIQRSKISVNNYSNFSRVF